LGFRGLKLKVFMLAPNYMHFVIIAVLDLLVNQPINTT